ncbi:MAG: hypothetical protein MUF01_10415 [Bryobacterales bacterium]|nr:hypothetical protein [Bryobacterales bacterium]
MLKDEGVEGNVAADAALVEGAHEFGHFGDVEAHFGAGREVAKASIQPWPKNPAYWQYDGKPVLLLGASDDDNLFQWPAAMLQPHLDAMQRIGANYVRNTMSDRVDLGHELYPYLRLPSGKYDLNQWNPEYWERFERFLRWTAARGILVQIEVWDRFDYSRDRWPPHPYNPANNINYTHEDSGLAAAYEKHPGSNEQPFFFTTPRQRNNGVLLPYQQRFVEKMLSYSLQHGHVLYCMDNETHAEPAWGAYWADFIKQRAKDQGKRVYVTEMWDKWNIKSDEHRSTLDHPELYDFVDLSQNNHNKGDVHWENALWAREYVKKGPRPINAVKTYGADTGPYGNSQDGLERFFRHVLAGFATARFHRPPSGLGLSPSAQAAVQAIRKMETLVPAWELKPAMERLSERAPNEAYLAKTDGWAFVAYFPSEGSVKVALPGGEYTLRWIDGVTGDWGEPQQLRVYPDVLVSLNTPSKRHWLALITLR